MENKIELKNCAVDFETINSSEFKHGVLIKVFSDVQDLLICNTRNEEMEDGTIFSIWLECGQKTIMMDVEIDELELFSNSLVKHIEIIRKTYGQQINNQADNGCRV